MSTQRQSPRSSLGRSDRKALTDRRRTHSSGFLMAGDKDSKSVNQIKELL